jgi:tricorn protease
MRSVSLVLLLTSVAFAQEPIKFARTPDISPDGKQIAFSYLGDIWTVEAIGGVARPVTMHEAHDYFPFFSPDGRSIAFSSNRYGSYDLFIVPVAGGKPKRLTFDSGSEVLLGFSPDGKHLIYNSSRSSDYPGFTELYRIPVEGGAEQKITGLFEAKEAYYSTSGSKVAFVRGPGSWNRRGYRGSSNDDLYIADADGKNTRQLTSFNGQDTSPMWSPDGSTVYYVTEQGSAEKCSNIVKQSLNGLQNAGAVTPVTTQNDDLIRRARISRNGDWIVYECGADLWVTSTKSGAPSPRKLAIEVHADDKANTERSVTFTRDATEYALSPDERHAVIVAHGQLFLTKVPDGGKAKRLTEHAAEDSAPIWNPDGQKVYFLSDRNGVVDVYMIESDDPENPALTKAHKFKTTQITTTGAEESGLLFNPKGDLISYLRNGQLWTMKPDGSDQKVLVADKRILDYEWSPDGKWIAYSKMDGSFASELFLMPVDKSKPALNVSRYATYNSDITWGGGKIAFISQRRGSYSIHLLPLQKPAADGTKTDPNEVDLDDIHLRIEKPSSMAVEGQGGISPDGNTIAFRAVAGGGDDLWTISTDGKIQNRITTSNQQPRNIKWSKRNPGTLYFLNWAGELRTSKTMAPGEPGKVPYSCTLTIQRDEEFAEMFAQSWRALNEQFYDSSFHNTNWQSVRAKYAPLVKHCASREDFYSMVSLMLGELNASHLGISGRNSSPDAQTAELGLLFDDNYTGPGLKIAEVVKRGPADKRGLNLKPGDLITHLDRTELTGAVNVSKLLNNRAGEGVLLKVKTGEKSRDVEVQAMTRDKLGTLLYDRWVAKNTEEISKQSNGKLGYVHIPSMDEAGLETFVRALYSDNFDKEGLVIDVRFNGGGFTHDQVLNYLVGKDHTRFVQRDGGEGMVMRNFDRKWAKPMVVLINNRSYSDAEIFPHAFRASGLGKVVGQATGGLVIGTSNTRLIDGSNFRLPRIGVYTNKNVNMDKQGVIPDVAVETTAEEWAKGVDAQIGKAVQVLTTDVVAWKAMKNPSVATAPATETKPATPTTPTAPTTEIRQPIEPATVKPKGSGEPSATKKPPEGTR